MEKKVELSITHEELMKRIEILENENKDLRKRKRYGLVWEEQEEEVEKQLKGNYPVLTEVKSREIVTDKSMPMNLLIEGDNLHSLQSLLYTHRNKLSQIYCDVPYNTGNKDFIYNDKMVDKEDTWRHSKWLSFISKRFKIARELLAEDGIIFISIDDNEQAQLKMLCDEIFGEENFVGQYMWQKTKTPPNLSHKIRKKLEYVLCYEKRKNNFKYVGFKKESPSDDPLTKPNNTIKRLTFPPGSICTKIRDQQILPGIYGTAKYPNILINTLEIRNGTNLNEAIFENRFIWVQDKLSSELYNLTKINLSQSLVLSYKKNMYAPEVPSNLIDDSVGVSTGEQAGNNLREIFDGNMVFDYPKPTSLIKYLLKFRNEKNSIILDFFAGSGTTGHAVMELNKEDGGNRQFILCTNNEVGEQKEKEFEGIYGKKKNFQNEWEAWGDKYGISRTVTYERLKRVINGYTTPKGKDVEGLGGNLKYYKTDIVYKTDDVNDMKYELLDKSLDLLSIKENTFELIEDTDMFKLFRGQDKLMGVYLDNYPDYPLLDSIMEKMNEDGIENKLLYVAEGTDIENDEKISELKSTGIEVKKIPNKIMQILEGK